MVAWIKNQIKRIMPPPVKAFMREIKNIIRSIDKSNSEIKALISKLEKKISVESEKLSKENTMLKMELLAQESRLKDMYDLFESLNRENLRIFFESKKERESFLAQVERQRHIEEKQENILKIARESQDTIKTVSSSVAKLISWVPERYMYNNDYERRVTASFKEYRQRADYTENLLALLRELDDESAEVVTRILGRQEKIWDKEGKPLDILTDEENNQIRYLKQHFSGSIFKISENIYSYKNFLLPINHFEPNVFVDRYGVEKIRNSKYFSNKCIIDVGAFIGDSALILSPLTSSLLYAFEATSKYFNLLQKTIQLNNIKNIVPVHVALGAECGLININIASSSSTVLTPNIEPEGNEEVEMITLDSFVEHNRLEVGLIKVDIEGFEREFLKGAEKTIRSQRPTLIISIYHYAADFFEIKPTIESWNLGYTFKIHKPIDYSISRETLLIAELKNA